MTEEKFVAYFYGASTDDVHLAEAMQRARCAYGIHLDMNAGHTGLEFYRAGPASEILPLNRPLQPRWEAEGEVLDMPGWRFRGRRMLRNMGLMNFPRYINREGRDFFYLTLRHILPGEPLAAGVNGAEPEEGEWRVAGLPQHGWPYAITTTWLRPDAKRPATKVRVLKVDPRMVRIAEPTDDRELLVLAIAPRAAPPDASVSLYALPRHFAIAGEPPANGTFLVAGFRPGDAENRPVVAAVGIDAAGMLVYAEIATSADDRSDGALLGALLERLGCSDRLLLDRPLPAAIGGSRDIGDRPVVVPRKSVLFVRGEAPGARRIFTDTPVVKPDVWFKLQSRRVRYFKKPKPPTGPAADGPAAPPPPGDARPASTVASGAEG
jgi:hypothetical protein